MSTVVLHHLPAVDALDNIFSQIKRILKYQGGLYLVDFAHLKTEKAINNFAYQYADRQAELFTLDYLYSLQAAFWPEDFYHCYDKHLTEFGNFYKIFIVPYMMVVKSPAKRELDNHLKSQLNKLRQPMPNHHKTDIKDLINFFSFGGLKCNFLK